MTVKELIENLEKMNPDSVVILFDEYAIPYSIHSVVKDSDSEGKLDHINIKHIELT